MAWVLAVDTGNTVTRLAAVANGEVLALARLPTRATDFPDLVAGFVERIRAGRNKPALAVGISCVVPELTAILEEAVVDSGGVVVTIGPENGTGLVTAYRPLEALGSDRFANAMAAWECLGAPCIAVDLGTALTVEVVDTEAVLRGGVLFPGLEAANAALVGSTARLAPLSLCQRVGVIGGSTAAGIAAGLGYGFPALIEGLLARIREELSYEAPGVLTGGGVRSLAILPQGIQLWDPHLTLRGVASLAGASLARGLHA